MGARKSDARQRGWPLGCELKDPPWRIVFDGGERIAIVNADGSRIVFTGRSDAGGPDLYVRRVGRWAALEVVAHERPDRGRVEERLVAQRIDGRLHVVRPSRGTGCGIVADSQIGDSGSHNAYYPAWRPLPPRPDSRKSRKGAAAAAPAGGPTRTARTGGAA